jgi:nitroreductase
VIIMKDTTQPESPLHRNPDLLRSILERRSTRVLTEPGPTPDEIALLLRAAASVPDHGLLRPFRFVVVQGQARDRFGDALAAAVLQQRPDLPPAILEKARRKAFAAPLLIVLIASPRAGARIPEWEQLATAACTGYAIVLAAHALGLGAIWKSTPFVDARALR